MPYDAVGISWYYLPGSAISWAAPLIANPDCDRLKSLKTVGLAVARFNLAPSMHCGKNTPGKYLHIFPRWVTPLLARDIATWLLCYSGITTSCARRFTCAPSFNQSWREPHECHRDVAIYCACLTRMSCALWVRFDQDRVSGSWHSNKVVSYRNIELPATSRPCDNNTVLTGISAKWLFDDSVKVNVAVVWSSLSTIFQSYHDGVWLRQEAQCCPRYNEKMREKNRFVWLVYKVGFCHSSCIRIIRAMPID